MKKITFLVYVVILSGLINLTYAQQTMTFEERIRAEVEFPKQMVFGGRQSPEFPKATLDLKPGDILARVPPVLYQPDPVERKPLLNFQVNERDKYILPHMKIEFELRK